jgi:hypothetical protein
MRGESADALAVEGIKDEDGDREIEEREYRCGVNEQPAGA